METKYKTDATERKAPEISVCVHLESSAKIDVRVCEGADAVWIGFSGDAYPSVSVWMTTEKLIEVRDVIAAYLENQA